MQLAHPEVAQPNGSLSVSSLPLFLLWSYALDWNPKQTPRCRYLPVSTTRQGLKQGQKPEGQLNLGWRGVGGRERAESRTMLVYVTHRLTWCNVSQVVSRTQMWSGHVCRLMAWTRQQGLVPYIGYKEVNNAACLPGGSLAETGSLAASSLPLFFLGSHTPDRSPEQTPGYR